MNAQVASRDVLRNGWVIQMCSQRSEGSRWTRQECLRKHEALNKFSLCCCLCNTCLGDVKEFEPYSCKDTVIIHDLVCLLVSLTLLPVPPQATFSELGDSLEHNMPQIITPNLGMTFP